MSNASIGAFIGIDVQSARSSPFAVLDAEGRLIDSGWIYGESSAEIGRRIEEQVRKLAGDDPNWVAVGVDAPRRPRTDRRQWYWAGKRRQWRPCGPSDRGWGRHSDVVVAALRLANPQWTPPATHTPRWMRVGFAIFEALHRYPHVHEVFPSASYTVLKDVPELSISIDFSNFAAGPKDMLDACVGALTVREYVRGRGVKVGDGDGLGGIILPRDVSGDPPHPVLSWPD